MQRTLFRLFLTMQDMKSRLVQDESGQDLIEYALVAALIALAATAGMTSVATSLSAAFTSISTKLSTYSS